MAKQPTAKGKNVERYPNISDHGLIGDLHFGIKPATANQRPGQRERLSAPSPAMAR
jgi:hypothetical protein